MEREIKFRAWNKGIMIYPDSDFSSGKILQRYDTIMQYTGLKDKNGKEIYEGDIVLDEGEKRKILWFDEGAQFITQTIDDSDWSVMSATECGGDYEIIGNVYEHPELLK